MTIATKALFTPAQIAVAALLKSPLPAFYLLSRNYRTSGEDGNARLMLVVGGAVTVLILVMAFNLTDRAPHFLITIIYTVCVHQIAKTAQGPLMRRHTASGGAISSWWSAVGYGFLGMVVILVTIAAIVFALPDEWQSESAATANSLRAGEAVLWAGPRTAGEEAANSEILVLSPFQVVAKSLEMVTHYSTHQGKKTLEYIRVKNVAKDSLADRGGLRTGDRIVAINGWRLEGQELSALNRNFPTKLQAGEPVLILTVRRPHHDEEHDVALPFPLKERSPKAPDQQAGPTIAGGRGSP